MSTSSLRQLLRQWFQAELDDSPGDDARRTPECLRFHEIEGYAQRPLDFPQARRTHVEQCGWCQRAVALLARVEPTLPGQFRISTGPEGHWSRELSARLAAWLTEVARGEQERKTPLPAHFDSEGTLRVHWTGVSSDGPVSVSLIWQGVEVPLARGVARDGVLEIAEPLPALGLRNLELPSHVLQIQPQEELETPSE